jgi:hypothetical protein
MNESDGVRSTHPMLNRERSVLQEAWLVSSIAPWLFSDQPKFSWPRCWNYGVNIRSHTIRDPKVSMIPIPMQHIPISDKGQN